MKKSCTWHIHINGQVQGVGFRPFIYQLAQKFKLMGWVNNAVDGIHIEFNADETVSKFFYDAVLSDAPQLSYITTHSIEKKPSIVYKDFKIISSNNSGNPLLLLSPDFAMCGNCRKEISDKLNRRYNYGFTTCTQCGPRYSIIKQLPYDRENSTMDVFTMCSRCNAEYNDPMNRRHFSQTNSCPDCPVVMKLFDNSQNMIEENQARIVTKICDFWSRGKIVAIKGIGGYLLTCDASNQNTVKELRKRKHRPAKPFGLMFPDILSLKAEAHVNESEITELISVAAPIVLLQLKNKLASAISAPEIAPGLSTIGAMLSYTPLHQLLLQQFGKPIVATSGNISNAPIVFEDGLALNELNTIADYLLVHNREIIAPQDDSVVTFSRHSQQRIMIRRARGFAPFYSNKNITVPQTTILATGAMLKSSFTLLHRQNIHISQYLGDTDNYDAQKKFDKTLRQFLELFHARPEVILIDLHPGYFSSQMGEQLSKKLSSQLVRVPHHEAHFASVLGEHSLLDETEPIVGVVWDGTGLGNDSQIWGGDFFVYHQKNISRVAHFDYFDNFMGDKMASEPRLSAFSLFHKIEEAISIIQPKFTKTEWSNYQKLIANNQLKTSSAGRIFDAVASLLGLIDKTSYEGEAAMLLEEKAHAFFKGTFHIPNSWVMNNPLEHPLSTQSLMRDIVRKIKEGENESEIAAWFHVQLVLTIQSVAALHHCRRICFSGGVFQNGLLIDLLIKILGDKYQLYFNKDLSPNDENISFGQLIWFIIMKQGSSIN